MNDIDTSDTPEQSDNPDNWTNPRSDELDGTSTPKDKTLAEIGNVIKINNLLETRNKLSESLFYKGQQILSDFLLSVYFKELDRTLSPGIFSFLKILGPFLLEIKPQLLNIKSQSTSAYAYPVTEQRNCHSCDLVKKINRDIWLSCISPKDRRYLLDTDLVPTEETIDLAKCGKSYIPGYDSIKQILCNNSRNIQGDLVSYCNAHVLVMGMRPENRAFMAVVLDKDRNDSELTEVIEQRNMIAHTGSVKLKLLSAVPSIISINDIAKEYGIKELSQIIEDFNSVIEKYNTIWQI